MKRMVINLFIEGEEPEYVEVEDDEAEEAAPGAAAGEAPPETAADRAFMQAIVDGTVSALEADLDRLIAIGERYENDAEMQALFEQAVNAVSAAADKATANIA